MPNTIAVSIPSQSLGTPKSKRILGIDPGLGRVGFGLLTSDATGYHLTAQRWGVITTTPKTPEASRLQEIERDLDALLNRLQPDHVAVEKLYFVKNTTALMGVTQARGVILLVLGRLGLPIYEYTPMQVKQALTGYGKAAKGEVQQSISQLLQLEKLPQPDDAADALAIAVCHIRQQGHLG
ncbi:MAG: crossover junction endodeoxyribonuclease RuvC [Candidatus Melainabacteria bacterium]|nr:crossover junction endodeoxyribonuclease RuvC [Candidatus Melainabacteria bacterium]